MSSIWHRKPDLDIINNQMNKGTIGEHLEILMTEVGDDYITGTMPADARTFQPYGVVHGGANVVLAESLGSIAGAHVIDFATSKCLDWSLVRRDLYIWVVGRISGRFASPMMRVS